MNPNFFSAVLFGTTFFSQFCLAQGPLNTGHPDFVDFKFPLSILPDHFVGPPANVNTGFSLSLLPDHYVGPPANVNTGFSLSLLPDHYIGPPANVTPENADLRIVQVEPLSAGGYSGQITAVGNSNGSNNLGESGIGQLKLTLLANGTYTGSARFLGRRISFKGVAGAVGATTVAKVTSKASRAVTVRVTPLPDGYANLKIRVKNTTYSGQVILQ
jgi:hypothetical protein